MDPFVRAVGESMARFEMTKPGERVVIALSGGPDSVALTAALVELSSSLALQLVAAHLNHALRGGDSDRDEDVARVVADRLGVSICVDRLVPGELAGVAGGLEQAARRARYDFLHRVARERSGCNRIATGHTRDDQAETFLLRLLRGSQTDGLAGIHPVRRDGVIRPLIEVGREDVVAYLARRDLPFAQDLSNEDARFTRNRVRGQLMPALRSFNPRIGEHLARLSGRMSAVSEVEAAAAMEIAAHLRLGGGALRTERLMRLPHALQLQVLRAWLGGARGSLRRIDAAHLEALARCAAHGGAVSLPGGGVVRGSRGELSFRVQETFDEPLAVLLSPGHSVTFGRGWHIQASPVHPFRGELDVAPDLSEAVLDADQVELPLSVRPWSAGDRLQPLGMTGHRKLSDVFIDRKVGRLERGRTPVVETAGEILWIPGLVRSERGKITPGSLRVIRLRAQGPGRSGPAQRP